MARPKKETKEADAHAEHYGGDRPAPKDWEAKEIEAQDVDAEDEEEDEEE